MKLITAIIKPFKLDSVREALANLGVRGMTVTEVKGVERQKGRAELFGGVKYAVEFQPKTKIEIAINDDGMEQVVDAVRQTAQTGKVGDGKLFVFNLGEAVRIRTGEASADAI